MTIKGVSKRDLLALLTETKKQLEQANHKVRVFSLATVGAYISLLLFVLTFISI